MTKIAKMVKNFKKENMKKEASSSWLWQVKKKKDTVNLLLINHHEYSTYRWDMTTDGAKWNGRLTKVQEMEDLAFDMLKLKNHWQLFVWH